MYANTLLAQRRVEERGLGGRRAVFEAAQTLFALQGYAATPLTQIGDAVGLRAGSLYNHIESKQELLLRLVAEAGQLLRSESYGIFRPRPPAEALRVIAFTHLFLHVAYPWQMLILSQDLASVEGPLSRRLEKEVAKYRQELVGVIGRGQEAEVFQRTDAVAAAGMVLGAGPVQARRAINRDDVLAEEAALAHAELALRLVGARP